MSNISSPGGGGGGGTGSSSIRSVVYSLDGQGGALTVGNTQYITVPFGGTIVGWDIVATGAAPTCQIDVWKIANGTALPTILNTIMGTKPTLASGNAIHSAVLTNWTTTVTQYDIIGINLDLVANALKLTFVLEIQVS